MGLPGKLEIWIGRASRKPFTALLHGPNTQSGVAGTSGPVLLAVGTTVPAGGLEGFGKGCAFYLTNSVTGLITAIYSNSGTLAVCNFARVDQ